MKVRYWLSVLPADMCGVFSDKFSFWFDDKIKNVIKKEVGKIDILISAGFHSSFKRKKFRKDKDMTILADSGGFQFYFLTPGRQQEFYSTREDMYNFQLHVGDYILGGDIPTGQEMPDQQLRKYADMTRDNIALQFKLGCTPDKFINILHGISPYSMETWYKYVCEYANIGWAIGAKASGALGPIFQMLFLIEKGELTKDKLVHYFALSGRKTMWQVFWAMEQLGLLDKLVLSSDSSSFSLGRFGGIFYEDGIIRYDEVRAGKELRLWDGRIIKDIPKRLDKDLSYALNLTSAEHFLRWMRVKVFEAYEKDKKEVNKVIRQSGLDKIIRYFQMGGIETAWGKMYEKVGKKNKTKMVDGMFVEHGKKGKKL